MYLSQLALTLVLVSNTPRRKPSLKKYVPLLCGNCKNFNPSLSEYKYPCLFRIKIPRVFCRKQDRVKIDVVVSSCHSLPSVMAVRHAIESVKVECYRVYLMTVYLCGAARACEIAFNRSSADKSSGYTMNYGPYGDDAWLDNTEPPDPQWLDVLEMLLSIQQGSISIKDAITKAKTRIPVVVFKIKIAKTHGLVKGEEAPYRLVALPLSEDFEPWTKIIYKYFQMHKGKPVFPFSRAEIWDYISRKDPVFKGLTYRIKKYTYNDASDELLSKEDLEGIKKGLYNELIETSPNKIGLKVISIDEFEYRMDYYGKIYRRQIYKVLSHPKPLKIHGLRHIRTDELVKYRGFDGVDLVAYVGWSGRGVALPNQAGNYAELRECWHRYIKKLCVEFSC
jgi:hypothetical protein